MLSNGDYISRNMIKSFKCKATRLIFEEQYSRKFPGNILRRAIIKLVMLDSIERIDELSIPPSNHLEKLSGDRREQYSIRINDQFRLCFEWEDGHSFNVEIVDYH